MANWKNVSEDTFKIDYKDSYSSYPSGKHRLTLQYDADSESPTSVKVRFKWFQKDSDLVYGQDEIYLIYDANNTDGLRSLYKIKGYESGNVSAYYTSTIILTKTYTSSTFFLQDVWICNAGKDAVEGTTATDFYNTFKVGGERSSLAYRQSAGQSIKISTSTTVATAVKAHAPTITDNGNNTFTITAKAGTAGDNNKVNNTSLYYRIGSSGSWKTNTWTTTSNKTITDTITATASAASQTIYAYTTVDGVYNDATSAPTSDDYTKKSIINYQPPTKQPKPTLTYNKSRLTIKENWLFKWNAATAANTSSKIKGYIVGINKNGSSIPWTNIYGSVSTTKNDKGWNYADTTSKNITIDPKANGIKPGDKIEFWVTPYTTDGKGTRLYIRKNNGDLKFEYVDEVTVQNAGVVQVCVNTGTTTNPTYAWKEGTVHVAVNTGTTTNPVYTWKEAETVNVAVNTGTTAKPVYTWKESE